MEKYKTSEVTGHMATADMQSTDNPDFYPLPNWTIQISASELMEERSK